MPVAPGTIGPVAALKAAIDHSHQDVVAPEAGAWASVESGVKALAGYIQRLAQPSHRPDGPVLRDESEPHIASLAKKAAALLRNTLGVRHWL